MKLRLLIFFYLISVIGIKTVCMEDEGSTDCNKKNEIKAIKNIRIKINDIIHTRNDKFLYTIDNKEKKLNSKYYFSIENCESDKINPEKHQTTRGLFLAIPHNRTPWTFWTRWGEYQPFRIQGPNHIAGINIWDNFWDTPYILNALKEKEVELENSKYSITDDEGKKTHTIFKVEKVKKIILYYAETKKMGNYTKTKKALKEWKKMWKESS